MHEFQLHTYSQSFFSQKNYSLFLLLNDSRNYRRTMGDPGFIIGCNPRTSDEWESQGNEVL